MTEIQKEYMHLTARLLRFRQENPTSDDDDDILDRLDAVWYKMTSSEIAETDNLIQEMNDGKISEEDFIKKHL